MSLKQTVELIHETQKQKEAFKSVILWQSAQILEDPEHIATILKLLYKELPVKIRMDRFSGILYEDTVKIQSRISNVKVSSNREGTFVATFDLDNSPLSETLQSKCNSIRSYAIALGRGEPSRVKMIDTFNWCEDSPASMLFINMFDQSADNSVIPMFNGLVTLVNLVEECGWSDPDSLADYLISILIPPYDLIDTMPDYKDDTEYIPGDALILAWKHYFECDDRLGRYIDDYVSQSARISV